MEKKFQAPRGTSDILPGQSDRWREAEKKLTRIALSYGYEEIRTPIFEGTALFARGVGDTTDIVTKEMYTFSHGEESLTLRPEGTAPVIRSFIENGMASGTQPVKLFYLNPTFRAEKPQKGRYRQFHQFGVEGIGSASAAMDAETIAIAHDVFADFGIADVELFINSVGCPHCRQVYNEALVGFLSAIYDELCEDCQSRAGKNPMRVLDCKNERCGELTKDAPVMLDYLDEGCAAHFEELKAYLDGSGIPYTVDTRIVRGLDYYTRTAYEFRTTSLGSQSAVCGGGRYDGLCETLGGPATPAVGFGMGLERLLLLWKEEAQPKRADLYIAPLNNEARYMAQKIAREARALGKSVLTDTMERSLKAQMKYADKIGAKYTAMIGEDELAAGEMLLRDMDTKEQFSIKIGEVAKLWQKK